AMEFLLSDDARAAELRRRFSFLIIPLLDPDGAANAVYENITMSFVAGGASQEAIQYADALRRWTDAGGRLDIALNLHNPSPGHRWHLTCFEMEVPRLSLCRALHGSISKRLTARGMFVEPTAYRQGVAAGRMGWWLR